MKNNEKIKLALTIALRYGQIDGAHHKAWVIDQIVRALTGCPKVEKIALDYLGLPYSYLVLGESEEYRKAIADFCNGEDGPDTYYWDCGVAP
jgi:hypothetical protein